MKKITLFAFAFALMAGTSLSAQIVLTQNTGDVITGENSVGCQSGDNFWARNFILADYGVDATSEFIIGSASFGVQSSSASNSTVTATVYTSNASFPTAFSESNSIGSKVVSVPANTQEVSIDFDFDAPIVVPAGTTAVLFIISTDLGNELFIGGTASATAAAYLKSASCGLDDFTTPGAIGFDDAHFYMTLTQGENLGIEDNVLANSLSVFPNPTNGDLNIKFSESVGTTNVSITTLSGQKVINTTISGFETNTIATSQLANGVYFAEISTANATTTVKFIKN